MKIYSTDSWWNRIPACFTITILLVISFAQAQSADAVHGYVNDYPLPASVVVVGKEAVIRKKPRMSARRGVARHGARLPVYAVYDGSGCPDLWFQVHVDGWVCGRYVDFSDQPPEGVRYPVVPEGKLAPWPYGFVHEEAIEYTRGFGGLQEVREVLPGFGVGIAGVRRIDGMKYIETAEGNFIPSAAVRWGRVSDFSGVQIGPGAPWPVGWVLKPKAWVYDSPNSKRKKVDRLERFASFVVEEFFPQSPKPKFLKTGPGRWIRADDARWTTPASLPVELKPFEKWIDVDTRQQIVVAYEGARPVYATMASTGRWGKESETPPGTYRIWAKVSAIAMDNTDEEEETEFTAPDGGLPPERHLYSLHDVPWTMFFQENFALHGVYWHRSFGYRRSHGCVNLAPSDAAWFYNWARPVVPDGWWAIHSSKSDPGTIIKVR